eukprot:4343101-Amphidinium_carterae.1
MQATLKMIAALRPSFGVAENVKGFAIPDEVGAQSALQYFRESLASHGYFSEVVEACLSSFHCCVRRRLLRTPDKALVSPSQQHWRTDQLLLHFAFGTDLLQRLYIVFANETAGGSATVVAAKAEYDRMMRIIEDHTTPLQVREVLETRPE